ncbi:MAG: hypothetical protein R2834_12830 [Rhodothermales bacterium]
MYYRFAYAFLALGLVATSVFAQETQNVAGWNVRYQIPAGWSLERAEGRLRVFVNPDASARLFVAPGISATPAEIQNDLIALGSALGLQGQPTSLLQQTAVSGRQVVAGEYDLFLASTRQRVLGRSVTVLSDQNTTLGMLVLAYPNTFAGARAALDGMVATARIDAPTVNRNAITELAGRWTYYASNRSSSIANSGSYSSAYEETVWFDGQGRFEMSSSSQVSASSSHYSPDASTTTASSFGGGNAEGTYTVIGNALIVDSNRGKAIYDFTMQGGGLNAGGKLYIRE